MNIKVEVSLSSYEISSSTMNKIMVTLNKHIKCTEIKLSVTTSFYKSQIEFYNVRVNVPSFKRKLTKAVKELRKVYNIKGDTYSGNTVSIKIIDITMNKKEIAKLIPSVVADMI